MAFDQDLLDAVANNSITKVKVRAKNQDYQDVKDDLQEFSRILQGNNSVVELDVQGCVVGDEGTKHLCDALVTNIILKKLTLSNSKLANDAAVCLSEWLTVNQALTHLDLSYNEIGTFGCVHLADALKVNRVLETLDLAANRIHYPGCGRLASALKVNESLKVLNLNGNYIGSEGAESLANALKVNCSLEKLDIGSGHVANIGAYALGDALRQNTTLEVLNLSDNAIRDDGANALANGLQKDISNVVVLDVSRNGIALHIENRINVVLENKKIQSQLRKNFIDTLNSKSKKTFWNRSRVMFVGQARAGKSSLVRSFLDEAFQEGWDSTIGVQISETESVATKGHWTKTDKDENASEFAARIIMLESTFPQAEIVEENKIKEKKSSRFKFPGRASKSKSSSKPPSSNTEIRTAEGNITSAESTDATPEPKEEKITREFNQSLLTHFGRNDLILSLWDFGGQSVFYAMHHIFLTKTGIYIMVFDMRELLNLSAQADALSYVAFWLKSIRLHAPDAAVLIVGTFADEIQERKEIAAINNALLGFMGGDFPQVVRNNVENLTFFSIDNQSGTGIRALRKKVEDTARNDARMTGKEVSMQHIVLLDKILSMRKNSDFVTFDDVKAVASTVGIRGHEALEQALTLFHERGLLIYLTSTETLRNIIIIQPQWLIDALAKVIRDGGLHRFDATEIEKRGLTDDLKMTFESGVTTRDFLEYVWGKEHWAFFLDLMERTMLLSEWKFKHEQVFLIPSVLHQDYQGEKNGLRCIFDFSRSFLPNGVFQRMICLLVAHSSRSYQKSGEMAILERPKLFKNFASVDFEPGFRIKVYEDTKLQHFYLLVDDNSLTKSNRSLIVIQSMLRKINSDIMGNGLSWEIFLEDCTTGEMTRYL